MRRQSEECFPPNLLEVPGEPPLDVAEITFESWPRFSDAKLGDKAPFPGWPITIAMDTNDGRKVRAKLPVMKLDGVANPVVQVIPETIGEILHTVSSQTPSFTPRGHAPVKSSVKPAGTERTCSSRKAWR